MSGVTVETHVSELEERHRHLHEEVSKLERRAFLTPEEQRLMVILKKQKLQAKDELYAARRSSAQPAA